MIETQCPGTPPNPALQLMNSSLSLGLHRGTPGSSGAGYRVEENMRRFIAICLVTTVIGCGTSSVPSSSSAQEDAVKAVISGFEDAWNRHDMDAFAHLFADEADFVNVRGTRWVGRKTIKDAHAASHAAHFKNSTLSIRETSIRFLKPEVAVTRSVWDLSGHTTRTGEIAPPRQGILTHVLTYSGGRWQIIVSQNTDITVSPGA